MNTPRANKQIKARKVRLISEEGENLGIFSLEEALQKSREARKDLIEISHNADPPVCKLRDLGKYLYQQKKKEKEKKGKQKGVGKVKSVRITPRIGEHDRETKIQTIKKFLSKGYRVRIEIFLRGREKANKNFAREKLENFIQDLEEEIEIKREGKFKKTPRGVELMISKK